MDLAKVVDNLLSKKQDDASLKQRAEQYLRPANCVFLEAPQVNKEIYGILVISIINVMEIINNNSANQTSDSLCSRTILKKAWWWDQFCG